jgi:hypothetical protein
MRKLTAIAVALGFLAASSLPTLAATATTGLTNTYELSAATEKKTMKKPSAAYCKKHPKSKACKKKKTEEKKKM